MTTETRTPNANESNVGRQWKLTRRRLDRILTAVAAGAPMSSAAKAAGIGTSTFWKYHALGLTLLDKAIADGVIDPDLLELAEENAQGLADAAANAQGEKAAPVNPTKVLGRYLSDAGWPEIDCLFVELVDGVARAEAEGELRLVTLVSRHAEKSWQAGIALLSRRWPERYREGVEITGEGGGPIHVATDAELARQLRDDPEARRLSSELLARVTPSAPVGTPAIVDDDDPDGEDDGDAAPPGE